MSNIWGAFHWGSQFLYMGVNIMKKVEFVRVKSVLSGYGLGKGTKYSFDGVEKLIKERIESGWDYCGYVPVETRGTGDIETMSLVFQKEE